MFDTELSDDEALELYRARKAVGTADEMMFMAFRGVVLHLGTQNGAMLHMNESLINHLDKHPANEKVSRHLDESHDSNVRLRFVQRMGGIGTAAIMLLVTAFGGLIAALQFWQLTHG